MSIGFLFWLIFIIAVVFGFWCVWTPNSPRWAPFGGSLVLLILIFLLGWGVFGFPIHG